MPNNPPKTPNRHTRQNATRDRLTTAAASIAGTAVFKSLGLGLRINAPSPQWFEQFRQNKSPLIYALWHGPHFPVLYRYRNTHAYVVASQSKDGEILARILTNLGYNTVRGSSSRGGRRALVQLARKLKNGADAALAVDGPRGPRYHAKPGVLLLAKLTGAPIIPLGASLSRYWQINSWDQYRIPKPFARAIIIPAKPLSVPRDADDQILHAARQTLQQRLLDAQTRADQHFNPTATPATPDPPDTPDTPQSSSPSPDPKNDT